MKKFKDILEVQMPKPKGGFPVFKKLVQIGPHTGFSIDWDGSTFTIQFGHGRGSMSGLSLDQVKKEVNKWLKKEIKSQEKRMEELKFLNRFMAKRIDKKAGEL